MNKQKLDEDVALLVGLYRDFNTRYSAHLEEHPEEYASLSDEHSLVNIVEDLRSSMENLEQHPKVGISHRQGWHTKALNLLDSAEEMLKEKTS